MLEIDAGVDHRHVHVHAVIIHTEDADRRVGVGENALDARGHRLRVDAAHHVLDHVGHPRVALEDFQPAGRHQRGHALEGVLVGEAGLQAVGTRDVRHVGAGVDLAMEDDDVGLGGAAALGHGRARRSWADQDE